MFDYITDLYKSLERFLGFEDDYDKGYYEDNKIILSTPVLEKPIISPVIIEPMITSENTFVAKY